MAVHALHLVGSSTDRFGDRLSRLYASGCLDATESMGGTTIAHVAPGGQWRFPDDLSDAAIDAARPIGLPEAIGRIGRLDPDVLVPQMFCLSGMTTYRGLFELLGIPQLGNPAAVMALAADKAQAKAVVAAAGVAVPAGRVLRHGDEPTVPTPAVVKPVDGDNSLGMRLVAGPDEWADALRGAFAVSDRVLVEEYVPLGREVRCGVLDRDGELVVLPLEEYRVDAAHPVRTAPDKIGDRDGTLRLMAKSADAAWLLDAGDPLGGPVGDAARRCFTALGCRDYGLFDFRVDPEGRPVFLEAGLYNSYSPQSVIPTMARGIGIGLQELFATDVEKALQR